MRLLPTFSMRGNRLRAALLCLLLPLFLAACAAPQERVITITRAEPVPYPVRPAFVDMVNGDAVCMSYEARMRLGQRHTQVVWYMRELENALKVYDAQTALPSSGMGGSAGGAIPPGQNKNAQTALPSSGMGGGSHD